MERQKIQVRLERAIQTRENLEKKYKSGNEDMTLKVGGVINYCKETERMCRLLLGKNEMADVSIRLTYKQLEGRAPSELITTLIQEARKSTITPVLKNMQKLTAKLLEATGYTLKAAKKISKEIIRP